MSGVRLGVYFSLRFASTREVDSRVVRFACDLCDYLATRKSSLKQHVRAVHEKLKDYQCVLCHLLFTTRQSLDKHIAALHDKIRNFVCEVCRMTFTQLNFLRQHEQSKQHLIRMITVNADDDNLSYYGRPRLLQIEQPGLFLSFGTRSRYCFVNSKTIRM